MGMLNVEQKRWVDVEIPGRDRPSDSFGRRRSRHESRLFRATALEDCSWFICIT